MNLEICSIASSSSGNSYVVRSEEAVILVDAGVTAKKIDEGLAKLKISYQDVDAILITHEHSDHINCLHTLVKRRPFAGRVYASHGTMCGTLSKGKGLTESAFDNVSAGDVLQIKDIKVNVFSLSHDTPQPTGYTFEKNGKKIAIVTDTGCVTEEIFGAISGSDILVLEANHEKNLLLYGRYPYPLKQRILSDTGHLSNETCALTLCRYLTEIKGRSGQTRTDTLREAGIGLGVEDTGEQGRFGRIPEVVLAHLSKENNTPMQAMMTVSNILEENGFLVGEDLRLTVAPRDMLGEILRV